MGILKGSELNRSKTYRNYTAKYKAEWRIDKTKAASVNK
jgi:hypothetical protein